MHFWTRWITGTMLIISLETRKHYQKINIHTNGFHWTSGNAGQWSLINKGRKTCNCPGLLSGKSLRAESEDGEPRQNPALWVEEIMLGVHSGQGGHRSQDRGQSCTEKALHRSAHGDIRFFSWVMMSICMWRSYLGPRKKHQNGSKGKIPKV